MIHSIVERLLGADHRGQRLCHFLLLREQCFDAEGWTTGVVGTSIPGAEVYEPGVCFRVFDMCHFVSCFIVHSCMITHTHSGGVVLFSSFYKSLFSVVGATRNALARLFAFFD